MGALKRQARRSSLNSRNAAQNQRSNDLKMSVQVWVLMGMTWEGRRHSVWR